MGDHKNKIRKKKNCKTEKVGQQMAAISRGQRKGGVERERDDHSVSLFSLTTQVSLPRENSGTKESTSCYQSRHIYFHSFCSGRRRRKGGVAKPEQQNS